MSESSRGFGYWLNIFANLAVVAGIVFVGVELQQNSQMMRAQTRHNISQGAVDLILGSRVDASFADVYRRGIAGEELTELEEFQYRGYLNGWLRYWEDVHYQYRSGLYDEAEFAKQMESTRDFLNRAEGFSEYWCERRAFYSADFMQEIDVLFETLPC